MSSALPRSGSPAAPVEGAQWVLGPEDEPDLDALITEDDAPVDNLFTEKQQRLLTESLSSSWEGPGEGRPFQVMSNVGLFNKNKMPPLVPDCMLVLDVSAAENLRAKENRSYFRWVVGKAPEVVIEIVSDRRGDEETLKKGDYARMGVPFYVIFDPDDLLGGGALRCFVLEGGRYRRAQQEWFEAVGLGLTLWQGAYEGARETWLRWCDRAGRVIPTGAERADEERRRADDATARADRLAAQLRALGIDPDAPEASRPQKPAPKKRGKKGH